MLSCGLANHHEPESNAAVVPAACLARLYTPILLDVAAPEDDEL